MSYRRLGAATTGAGALALVAIFALSSVASAGVAHPGFAFPGAYWSPFTYRDNSGCASAHAYPAHWSAKTGAGGMKGSTSAKTCPAYRGGNNIGSYGSTSQELSVWAPVAMPSGTGGINVTWNLKLVGNQAAMSTSTGPCANTQVYSYSYNYGYTWVNYTDTSTYCDMYASVDLYGFAYLYDMTTSTYFYPSNYWSSPYNYTENYTDMYSYSVTYSNSSYWAYNYSYSGNYSYVFGGPGSITGSYSPTWFINGTFVSTDSYQVITYVETSQSSDMYGWTGNAATSITMSGAHNHADLGPFSVW